VIFTHIFVVVNETYQKDDMFHLQFITIFRSPKIMALKFGYNLDL